MKKNQIEAALIAARRADDEKIRAKHENDLPLLLRPWNTFRLFIVFKRANIITKGINRGQRRNVLHRYGIENIATYSQCLHGHYDKISLNKQKGFDYCVSKIEDDWKGSYREATIYARSIIPGGLFDIPVRTYDIKGDTTSDQKMIDYLTGADQNTMLDFYIDTTGYIVIQTGAPTAQQIREEILKNLK